MLTTRPYCLILLQLLWIPSVAAQAPPPVALYKVSLAVVGPDFRHNVQGFTDGNTFFVDMPQLFTVLGFRVIAAPHSVEALDLSRRVLVDFAEGTLHRPDSTWRHPPAVLYNAEKHLLSTDGLMFLMHPDVHFDVDRLRLVLSTAGDLYRGILSPPTPHPHLVEGPLLFPRRRAWVGGITGRYSVSYTPSASPNYFVEATANALRGVVEFRASHHHQQVAWAADLPPNRFLTSTRISHAFGSTSLPTISLSNRPLARALVQHTAVFGGQATPHALVEALVSGTIVDRVEADREGQWRVTVPIYYGDTPVEIRTTPLGGLASETEKHYLRTPADLLAPGQVYYDVTLGQNVQGHFEYGVLPFFTARFRAHPEQKTYSLGTTLHLWRALALRADSDIRQKNLRINLTGGTRAVRGTLAWDLPSTTHAYVTLSSPSIQLVMSGSNTVPESGSRIVQISPTLSLHPFREWRLTLRSTHMSYVRPTHPRLRQTQWQSRLSRGFRVPQGHATLGIHAAGDHNLTFRRPAISATYTPKGITFGIELGYDRYTKTSAGGVSLALNNRFFSGGSRTRYRNGIIDSDHILSGSFFLGKDTRLGRSVHTRSTAVLRVFVDTNRNGIWDKEEPTLPGVEIDVRGKAVYRRKDGTLEIPALEDFREYQLTVIEESVHDPLLTPAMGFTFSFLADPGQTKSIDIPLIRKTVVEGTISGMTRPPSLLEVHFMQASQKVAESAVYRNGAFSGAVPPGNLTIKIIDVTTQATVAIHHTTVTRAISLIKVAVLSPTD